MKESRIAAIFDAVLNDPHSSRGLDVDATARLLAEAVRLKSKAADYSSHLQAVEEYYVRQFLNTAILIPEFPSRIKKAMKRFR